MIHQRHRRTDGQTDDMQSQDRALHYSTSRGNNSSVVNLKQHSVCDEGSLPGAHDGRLSRFFAPYLRNVARKRRRVNVSTANCD